MNKLKALITVIAIVSIISCVPVVSAIGTTEPATNTATSDELVTDDYTDALPVLIFSVSASCGILLGKAFSFWKW